MTPRFRKVIHFGLGFSVPIRWKYAPTVMGTQVSGLYNDKLHTIDIDTRDPLWERLRTYSHEILHAAIDFDVHCQRIAAQMEAEALEAKRLEEEE